ncbi:MAG TPA: hypothetical protein VFB06_30290 [Streptosporangiaceae bacterium]|nr:hypothetical protein [Streptosporangiaceae bacterium]
MFGLKARLGITTGVAIMAAGFAVLPASQALASARSCQNEANGFLEGCANVNGSGLHINSLQGVVTNIGVGDQHMVHLELSGPHGLIKNCPTITVGSLDSDSCTWSPNANETAGSYCVTVWQFASNKWVARAKACVGVHK